MRKKRIRKHTLGVNKIKKQNDKKTMKFVKLEALSSILEIIECPKNMKSLELLQESVGGIIEMLSLVSLLKDVPAALHNVDVVFNEEGKLIEGMKPNLFLYDDIIMGTVVFVGVNDEGDTIGLTQEQLEVLPIEVNRLRVICDNLKSILGV